MSSLLSPTGGGAAGSPVPTTPSARQDPTKDGISAGVLAQISDVAKSMFAQMRRDGISAESFDLKLDLTQLGMKVGANGSRSVEGHSLTVDLHVEAQQGNLKTDKGEVSFQKLDVSFSLQETYVRASQSAGQTPAANGALPSGTTLPSTTTLPTGSSQPPAPGSFVASLKNLIDLLQKTNGNPSPADGLGAILAQLGKAIEAMAQRQAGGGAPKPGADAPKSARGVQPLDGVQLQETIQIHALSISATQDVPDSPAASSTAPVAV